MLRNTTFESSAGRVAKSLGGARGAGSRWMCCCPAHDDRTPSLHISDRDGGGLLVMCFAGCSQGQVIAALRERGLWEMDAYRYAHLSRNDAPRELDGEAAKRTKFALNIWEAAASAKGTPVEKYLDSRGLHLEPPPSLRFHDGLKHCTGGLWPTMVALVTR